MFFGLVDYRMYFGLFVFVEVKLIDFVYFSFVLEYYWVFKGICSLMKFKFKILYDL